jgi:hypothetical protein
MEESYTVWVGDKVITSASAPKQSEAASYMEMFETCVHRTIEEVDIVIKTCCSSYTQRGFRCEKRDINFLGPTVCRDCPVYKKR